MDNVSLGSGLRVNNIVAVFLEHTQLTCTVIEIGFGIDNNIKE